MPIATHVSSRTGPGRRTIDWIVLRLVLAFVLWLSGCSRSEGSGAPSPSNSAEPKASESSESPRLVSLAPAVTETLVALGATDQLVAISDYCSQPQGSPRPLVGTAITPRYEAIARARPTLILATAVGGAQLGPLGRMAPTEVLPWLTLEEVTQSIRRMGTLTHTEDRARPLAQRFERTLSRTPSENAPRILLLMNPGDTGAANVWFIRRNSLHGALLHAAGASNAVARDVAGAPRLSLEEVMTLDPDGIIALVDERTPGDPLENVRKLSPLRAVQQDRLGVVRAPDALAVGPRILELVGPLRHEVERLAR